MFDDGQEETPPLGMLWVKYGVSYIEDKSEELGYGPLPEEKFWCRGATGLIGFGYSCIRMKLILRLTSKQKKGIPLYGVCQFIMKGKEEHL